MKILCVCGARPNFMKIDAVVRGLAAHPNLVPIVVHTGQHYDERLSQVMFQDLGLPRPDVHLDVGSASHAVQTAEIMKYFEPVVLGERPDLVLVVGDVNSTVACSLVAVKLGVPVAHVEAGLRSFDRTMPEEINRLITDTLSEFLFVSERSGVENLRREGVPEERIHFVGNVMIDTLLRHRERAEGATVLADLGLVKRGYAVLTVHRPGNVDRREVLSGLVDGLEEIQRSLPVVFPAHPRTVARLRRFDLLSRLECCENFRLIPPQGYLDFLKLMSEARVILTDSGGIQEEATVLEVPCLTLRSSTERPATLESGWNRLVNPQPREMVSAFREVMEEGSRPVARKRPDLWDGRAGDRIAAILNDLDARWNAGFVRSDGPRERVRRGIDGGEWVSLVI